MLSLLCFIPNLVFCVRFFFFPVSGFDKLSTSAFIPIAEAMTRGTWHRCLLLVFDPPVPGADLSNSDGDAGPTEGLPPPSPPLPSGPQSPSRVAGRPLASLELGAQGSTFSQPLPSPAPPRGHAPSSEPGPLLSRPAGTPPPTQPLLHSALWNQMFRGQTPLWADRW